MLDLSPPSEDEEDWPYMAELWICFYVKSRTGGEIPYGILRWLWEQSKGFDFPYVSAPPRGYRGQRDAIKYLSLV